MPLKLSLKQTKKGTETVPLVIASPVGTAEMKQAVKHSATPACAKTVSNHARKSHERHGQDASDDQGNRGAFHALRGFHQLDVLADARKQHQGQAKAQGDAHGIHHRLAKAQQMGHAAVVERLGDHGQSHAQNGAVGRNQRQKHAQGGVERRADFLQDNLYHLHQGGDDEDEGNGLHELVQAQGNQDVLVHKPCDERGQSHHENDGGTHTHCG